MVRSETNFGQQESGFVEAVYQQVLGRDADAESLAAWDEALGRSMSAGQMRTVLAHSAEAANDVNGIYQQVLGRDADPGGLASYQNDIANGMSLSDVRNAIASSPEAKQDQAGPAVGALYQQVLGRAADPGGLAANIAALVGGASLGQLRDSMAHSAEAAADIDSLYQQVLGRHADPSGLASNENALGNGASLGDLRNGLAHSAEAAAQVQAQYSALVNRPASPDEVTGSEASKALALPPAATFSVQTASGASLASGVDAKTLVTELATYVTLSGGQTPTLTASTGQQVDVKDGKQLAAFALAQAALSGQATAMLCQTYNLTTQWLDQVGQGYIQAAANLQARARTDAQAGNNAPAVAEYVGAQLAMQIQAMPADQRHSVTQRVQLNAQWAADVTVNGDVEGDASGLAGFSYHLIDLDPQRTGLLQQAQAQAAAAKTDAGNALLAYLDHAQERVDLALAQLPPEQRNDKMLGVAQQFVDAARQAVAQNNWNLVQTLETAADVSLQEAAKPAGQRQTLTETFQHKDVKHYITVNPNAANPFASFSDHSQSTGGLGAIIQQVVGVVVNVLAFVPGVNIVAAPLAVAYDAAQAGENFANGNILGGVLSLGSAAGVGLSGLGSAATAAASSGGAAGGLAGAEASLAGNVASVVGASSATELSTIGAGVLEGTALVGGAAGIAQGAASGDPLGVLAGALELGAAVAGGLVTTQELTGSAATVAGQVAVGAGLASAGANAADDFAHGDLAGGLLASLASLTAEVNREVNAPAPQTAPVVPVSQQPLPPPSQPAPPDAPTQTAPVEPVSQQPLPLPAGVPAGTAASQPLPVPPVPPTTIPPDPAAQADADAITAGMQQAGQTPVTGVQLAANIPPSTATDAPSGPAEPSPATDPTTGGNSLANANVNLGGNLGPLDGLTSATPVPTAASGVDPDASPAGTLTSTITITAPAPDGPPATGAQTPSPEPQPATNPAGNTQTAAPATGATDLGTVTVTAPAPSASLLDRVGRFITSAYGAAVDGVNSFLSDFGSDPVGTTVSILNSIPAIGPEAGAAAETLAEGVAAVRVVANAMADAKPAEPASPAGSPDPSAPPSVPSRVSNGVALNAKLPDPAAGLGYQPTILNSPNPNVANSQLNGYVSELNLANSVADLPGVSVVEYGDVIGSHGADIVSVDTEGDVTLWDAKYRSSPVNTGPSPTFAQGSAASRDAVNDAIVAIQKAPNLTPEVKATAIENLIGGNYRAITAGQGQTTQSIIQTFKNNALVP